MNNTIQILKGKGNLLYKLSDLLTLKHHIGHLMFQENLYHTDVVQVHQEYLYPSELVCSN